MDCPLQGHAAPILYAVWAEAGFLPESELLNLRKISSDLDGHPVPVSAPHQEPCRPLPPFPVSQGLWKGGRAPTEELRMLEGRGRSGCLGNSVYPKLVLKSEAFKAPTYGALS